MMPPVRSLLFTCSVMALACASPSLGYANPQDGVVTSGAATIVSNGSKLDIHQSTDKAVIDWRGFDIGSGEETEFHQLNSNSIALNRVNSNAPSSINGKLTANGNVVIINQNGVMFGAGSQVDVNGLVVSTADITNENFMNGTMKFDRAGNNPNAKIVNQGTITAKDAGLVGFVAPNVENSGVIVANLGRVHLASGDTATVDFYGDGLMEVQASDQLTQQIVKNTGTISANGGKVALTAAAGRDIVNSLIQVDGVIHAQSVGVHNGEIIIGAKGSNKTSKSGKSKVVINGTLDASGKQTGQTGGKITVTGDEVTLSSTARLDTSGHNGGGSIKLGGDYQGSGTTQTAKTLTVNSGSLITNDAIETGNGGTTILWSDGDTIFRGLITARGGSISGNGGFAEVSGKATLLFSGLVDLSAVDDNNFGTLLLDPTDITISSAADSNTTGTTSITGTAATSNINVTTLQNQLASANVTISTTSAYGGNGDITFVDAFSWSSGGRSLTLTATRDIIVNAAISSTGSGSSITATAGRDILFNANVVASAGTTSISATATRDLTVASGVTIQSSATGGLTLRAANGVATNTGLLTLNGILSTGTASITFVSGLDGSGNRADLTLNSTNFLMQGATIGTPTITGFRDITLNRNITSSANIAITAFRNLTVGSGATIKAGSVNNLSLAAANASTTGTGILTLTGTLNVGSGGTFTLVSGLDGSGNAADLTLDNTNLLMQGASLNTTSISGFRDININSSVTFSNAATITANRNLTIGSGATITSSGAANLLLRAANNVSTGTGIFTLNGTINIGTGTLTLVSGIDGSGERADLTLNNSTLLMQSGSLAGPTLTGFRDINLDRSITFSGNAAITANRNLTIGSGATIASSASGTLGLRAANAVATGTGVFTNNGTLSIGTGALTLFSGLDSSGNRADLTLDNTNFLMQSATIVNPTLTGFRDINLNRSLAFSNSTTITANRNLTVGSGVTLTSGATTNLVLSAANNVSTGLGILTLNGTVSIGTGGLGLASGVDGTGTRADLTLDTTNLLMQGATVGSITFAGFRDLNINRSMTSTDHLRITADRNLTIGTGVTLSNTSSFSMYLQAAGADVTRTGILTINGTVNTGSGELRLYSGYDSSGNGADLTIDSSNLIMRAPAGTTRFFGFRDLTINQNLSFSGAVTATAKRNLTIGTGVTVTAGTGNTILAAANNVVTGLGILTLNGAISIATTGTLSLLSGVDSAGNRADITLDNTNLLMQGATIVGPTLTGFRDITINRNLIGSSNISITANRNLTIGSGVTIQSGASSGIGLNATGLLTMNGILSTGTGTFTLTSGVDGSGNRADLTLDSTNFIMNGLLGVTSITGFRDITINTAMTSNNANMLITAERNLNIGSSAVFQTNNGFTVSLKAAGGNANNVGLLYYNGKINLTTNSTFSLLSGVDASGNRNDLTLDNTNIITLGATISGPTMTGFRDITINRDLIASNGFALRAYRNLTISNGVTLKTGSTSGMSLAAADAATGNQGVLTINGVLNSGTGILNLTSGLDSSNGRNDFIWDNTHFLMQGSSFGAVTISGFGDITFDNNLISNSTLTITAQRDIIINHDITSAGNMTIRANNSFALTNNSILTSGSNTGVNIAAGTGPLILNGILKTGTGYFGVDAGNSNLTLDSSNLVLMGPTIGSSDIKGQGDITLNMDLISTGYLTLIAGRNLTVQNLTTNLNNAMQLYAAGTNVNNTGIITLNGKLTAGKGGNPFRLVTGLDASGNRVDLVLNSTNFEAPNNLVGLDLEGYRDITLNSDINITSGVSLVSASRDIFFNSHLINLNTSGTGSLLATAGRDIRIGSGAQLTGGIGTTLVTGRNFINNSGSDAVSVDSGNWFIYSTSPETDTLGGLAYSFRKFGCTYGGGCAPGSGNGFFFSQSGADHDFYTIRSQFQQLPQTVEYTSQTPSVTFGNIIKNPLPGEIKEDSAIFTLDDALKEQLRLDSEQQVTLN